MRTAFPATTATRPRLRVRRRPTATLRRPRTGVPTELRGRILLRARLQRPVRGVRRPGSVGQCVAVSGPRRRGAPPAAKAALAAAPADGANGRALRIPDSSTSCRNASARAGAPRRRGPATAPELARLPSPRNATPTLSRQRPARRAAFGLRLHCADHCDGDGRVRAQDGGRPGCTASNQCTSGFCHDGYCCDQGCPASARPAAWRERRHRVPRSPRSA